MTDNVNFSFGFPHLNNNNRESFSEANSINSFNINHSNNTEPSDIFALAKAFLSLSSMTNKKLQKLCYYAKAWYLALYDENLISEDFQAWVHGAVQPVLYHHYKDYGFSSIPQIHDTANIPEVFLSFSKEIYDAYGHLTGDQLEELNHQESPWIIARGDCEPWETCTNIISETDMKSYYRSLL